MGKKRCFIAVNFPQWLKDDLNNIINQLKKINHREDINWVKSENCHLTLHFLGYIDERQIEETKKILSSILSVSSPTNLFLDNFDYFPSLSRPRVFFISLKEKGNSLSSIQSKLGLNLEKIGIRIEERPWHMHLTLARLKIPRPLKIIPFDFSKVKPVPVKSIELMESHLSPFGARYSIIQSFPINH